MSVVGLTAMQEHPRWSKRQQSKNAWYDISKSELSWSIPCEGHASSRPQVDHLAHGHPSLL